jgi:hypothetical protein
VKRRSLWKRRELWAALAVGAWAVGMPTLAVLWVTLTPA